MDLTEIERIFSGLSWLWMVGYNGGFAEHGKESSVFTKAYSES
jgi:hypothetical protein